MNCKAGQEILNIETGSGRDYLFALKSTFDPKRLIYRDHVAGFVNICTKSVSNKDWTAVQYAWRKHVWLREE